MVLDVCGGGCGGRRRRGEGGEGGGAAEFAVKIEGVIAVEDASEVPWSGRVRKRGEDGGGETGRGHFGGCWWRMEDRAGIGCDVRMI
jgi:hypothetical protein